VPLRRNLLWELGGDVTVGTHVHLTQKNTNEVHLTQKNTNA